MIIRLVNKELRLVGEVEERGGNTFVQGSVIQATNGSLFVVESITTDIKGTMTFVVEPFLLTR